MWTFKIHLFESTIYTSEISFENENLAARAGQTQIKMLYESRKRDGTDMGESLDDYFVEVFEDDTIPDSELD